MTLVPQSSSLPSSSSMGFFFLLLLDVGGREDADGAAQLPQPPPVRLLVVDVDDVARAYRQLVVHVGVVVVDYPGGNSIGIFKSFGCKSLTSSGTSTGTTLVWYYSTG